MTIEAEAAADSVLDALGRRDPVRSSDPAVLVLRALIADVDSIYEASMRASLRRV